MNFQDKFWTFQFINCQTVSTTLAELRSHKSLSAFHQALTWNEKISFQFTLDACNHTRHWESNYVECVSSKGLIELRLSNKSSLASREAKSPLSITLKSDWMFYAFRVKSISKISFISIVQRKYLSYTRITRSRILFNRQLLNFHLMRKPNSLEGEKKDINFHLILSQKLLIFRLLFAGENRRENHIRVH